MPTRVLLPGMQIQDDAALSRLFKARVYHVGEPSLQAPARMFSYEGAGLSVSSDPEAWRQIAQLGEAPTYQLRRKDNIPGHFFLWSSFSPSAIQELNRLCMERQWIRPVAAFRVWFIDSEDPSATPRFRTYYDPTHALQAHEELVVEGNPGARLEEITAYEATDLLQRRWLQHFEVEVVGDAGREAAWLFLLEDLSDADGVWWHAPLQPSAGLAPRGVIFPSRIPHWEWTAV